jgi:hypothetical protein
MVDKTLGRLDPPDFKKIRSIVTMKLVDPPALKKVRLLQFLSNPQPSNASAFGSVAMTHLSPPPTWSSRGPMSSFQTFKFESLLIKSVRHDVEMLQTPVSWHVQSEKRILSWGVAGGRVSGNLSR